MTLYFGSGIRLSPPLYKSYAKRSLSVKLLEQKIINDGVALDGNVLKVDSFLNHQIDVSFMDKLGREFARLFSGLSATKILTIEASGIALACAAAKFLELPVVFAKKGSRANIGTDVYFAASYSYTHKSEYIMAVSQKYLSPCDKVIIIDDFLAKGNALRGLISIVNQAGSEVLGIGIAIEKAFEGGGDALRQEGFNLRSLAVVESMDNGNIVFRK